MDPDTVDPETGDPETGDPDAAVQQAQVRPVHSWRRPVGAVAAVLVGVGLLVWPGPALWQQTRVTSARLLLRPAELVTEPGKPTAAGVPAGEALAATAFVGWDEPVRLRDRCLTRASVTMPAGWVRQDSFGIPGQKDVPSDVPSTVVVEQPAGVERFLRPTFVRAGRSAAAASGVTARARIERVCGGTVTASRDIDLDLDLSGLEGVGTP